MPKSINSDQKVLVEFIQRWRKMFDSLTEDERRHVSNLDKFDSPCQLEVVWLRSSKMKLDYQLWVVTHFQDEPDNSVIIHGPILSEEIQDAFAAMIESERFNRSVPEEARYMGVNSYRGLIEGQLLGFLGQFKREAIQQIWSQKKVPTGVFMKQWLTRDAFIWIARGEPKTVDYDSVLKHIMLKAPPTMGRAPAPAIEKKVKKKAKGFGTYIYPHVWVGSRPVRSFREQIMNQMRDGPELPFRPLEAVFTRRISNIYVAVTNDGFVAIGIKNRYKALQALNTFMVLLTLEGVPAFSVRDSELGELTIDKGGIGQSNMPIMLPRMQPLDPSFTRQNWQQELMPVIEIEKVKMLWNTTLNIMKDENASTLIGIFGATYTHFQTSEYGQAILLAWIFVEKWANTLWSQWEKDELLIYPGKGRRKYNIFGVIPILEKTGHIDKALAAEINQLLNLRNMVLHRFTQVTKEQAELALLTVLRLLRNIEKPTPSDATKDDSG